MFYDYLNLFSASSPGKIFNLIKLKCSYFISALIKKPLISGYPCSISIEPTTFCNLACSECPSGQKALTRAAGNMQMTLYKKITDELTPFLLYLNLYFQGEPFLHPDIFKMIAIAKEKKIYTNISTNGHFLNARNSKKIVESGLDRLIVCADGMTQEIYEIYRKNGNIEKIITGIKTLASHKKTLKSGKPHIIVQSLITRHNQYQLREIKKFYKHLGANQVLFKSIQINEFRNGNPLIPTISKYSRYKLSEDRNYIIKNRLANKCWRLWSSTVITQNGMVLPCCFDKDASYAFGNIYKNGLKDIWKNSKYNEFRKSILTSRKDIGICCNCTEGLSRIIIKK